LSKKSEKVLKVSWFRPSVFWSFFLLSEEGWKTIWIETRQIPTRTRTFS
jgi:hypothetical protein